MTDAAITRTDAAKLAEDIGDRLAAELEQFTLFRSGDKVRLRCRCGSAWTLGNERRLADAVSSALYHGPDCVLR